MKYSKARLSLLMFVQFFISGATIPIISLYLKDNLNFSGSQVGLILGLSAVSAIVSPIFMTFIADRLISSERLLCLLNCVGGVSMLIFSAQTEFYCALFAYIIYNIVTNPAGPLINAITFHHAPTDRDKFGNIRVWGTAGWIAVAWIFGFWILRDGGSAAAAGGSKLPLLLNISAITSFVMAAYGLTIPVGFKRELLCAHSKNGESSQNEKRLSPPREKRRFFPVDSFKVMLQPSVLALSLIVAAVTFTDKFYSVGAAPFLKQAGFSERSIMPAMSLGQIPELAAMWILWHLLKRWGTKAALMAGMVMAIFRFGACALGSGKLLICAGISVHGLAYTLTTITAVIRLDGYCSARDRAGVHQLFAVLTGGIGGFLGSYAAGFAIDKFTGAFGIVNYGAYWTIPLVLSVMILVTISIARISNHNVY